MIVTVYYKTRTDGVVLNRTYSDIGMMIERDSVRYSEAIDPVELNRTYTETDIPSEYEGDTATSQDYENALAEFGVKV